MEISGFFTAYAIYLFAAMSQRMIQLEQSADTLVADHFQLRHNLGSIGFFLDLFGNEPLQENLRSIVFFFQRNFIQIESFS